MGTPNSVIQPLQKIQNFAARLVLLAPRHHHSTPLLEKLHWLPISGRLLCFSAINGSGPAYLFELLQVYTPSHTLRSSSDTRMLEIHQYKRKTHGFRTFSCFEPHIWNSLPQDLRHCFHLSYCLTSTEARWPIRDGDRVGRGRESERLDRGNRPKKTGETVDRCQNYGSIKVVSPRHCAATCALRNCSFNCCAGQNH